MKQTTKKAGTKSTGKKQKETVADELIIETRGQEKNINTRAGKKKKSTLIPLAKTRSANQNPWDQAYSYALKEKVFAEPNIKSRFLKKLPGTRAVITNEYMATWPRPESGPMEFIWHLDERHSQLLRAYEKVYKKGRSGATVRIAHFDTGYLPGHPSTPAHVKKELGKSLIRGEEKNKGIDQLGTGSIVEQDGHGCATLAILAGNTIKADQSYGNYAGEFGAIPFAEVIPIRICDTVYNLFNANDVAEAIDYAVENGCEVITMSMAGYPTRRVARAVNEAYEKGVTIVTAAGNNWTKGMQQYTPKAVMYPARFKRVIAATGACYDGLPYDAAVDRQRRIRSEGGEFMQGNWGPEKAMTRAVAGYTPNLAWATMGNAYQFSKAGGGTSSATPQVAATVALWIAHNRKQLVAKKMNGTWKQVEAVRKAVFDSADKSFKDYHQYYGNGIIRAFDALDAFDFEKDVDALSLSEKATVHITGIGEFIGQFFRTRGLADASAEEKKRILEEMVSLELIQLMYKDPALFAYAEKLEPGDEQKSFFSNRKLMKEFKSKLKDSPYASEFIKGLVSPK